MIEICSGTVPGIVLISPGARHMVVQRSGVRYSVRFKDGPPVHERRPSVDVLFTSMARAAGRNVIGMLLTGIGSDGASSPLAMKDAGVAIRAQDEKSSVVFDMHREVVCPGAAAQMLPLSEMAPAVMHLFGAELSSKG